MAACSRGCGTHCAIIACMIALALVQSAAATGGQRPPGKWLDAANLEELRRGYTALYQAALGDTIDAIKAMNSEPGPDGVTPQRLLPSAVKEQLLTGFDRLQSSLRTGYERAWQRHFQNVLDATEVARQALNLTDVREQIRQLRGEVCSPALFQPPTIQPEQIVGLEVGLTIRTPSCVLTRGVAPLQEAMVLRCRQLNITYEERRARYRSRNVKAPLFSSRFCAPERRYGLQSTTTIDLYNPANNSVIAKANRTSVAGGVPLDQPLKALLLKAIEGIKAITISGRFDYGYENRKRNGIRRVIADLGGDFAKSVLGRRVRQAEQVLGEVQGGLRDGVFGAVAGAKAVRGAFADFTAGLGGAAGGIFGGDADPADDEGDGDGDDSGEQEDGESGRFLLDGALGRIRAKVLRELRQRRAAAEAARQAGTPLSGADLPQLSSGVAEVFREVAADGLVGQLFRSDRENATVRALVKQHLQQAFDSSGKGAGAAGKGAAGSGEQAGAARDGGKANSTAEFLAESAQSALRNEAMSPGGFASVRQAIAAQVVQQIFGQQGKLGVPLDLGLGLGDFATGGGLIKGRQAFFRSVMGATEREAAKQLLSGAGSKLGAGGLGAVQKGLEGLVEFLRKGGDAVASAADAAATAAAEERSASAEAAAQSSEPDKPSVAQLLEDIWVVRHPVASALRAVREQSRLSGQFRVQPLANVELKAAAGAG